MENFLNLGAPAPAPLKSSPSSKESYAERSQPRDEPRSAKRSDDSYESRERNGADEPRNNRDDESFDSYMNENHEDTQPRQRNTDSAARDDGQARAGEGEKITSDTDPASDDGASARERAFASNTIQNSADQTQITKEAAAALSQTSSADAENTTGFGGEALPLGVAKESTDKTLQTDAKATATAESADKIVATDIGGAKTPALNTSADEGADIDAPTSDEIKRVTAEAANKQASDKLVTSDKATATKLTSASPTENLIGNQNAQPANADIEDIDTVLEPRLGGEKPAATADGDLKALRQSYSVGIAGQKIETNVQQAAMATSAALLDNDQSALGVQSAGPGADITLQAATSASNVALSSPATGTMVAAQVTAAIRASSMGDQIEVRLDPPELGKVKIEFNLETTDAIKATVTSERPETLEHLKRHVDALADELKRAGFAQVDIEFSDAGSQSESFAEGEDGADASTSFWSDDTDPAAQNITYLKLNDHQRVDRLV